MTRQVPRMREALIAEVTREGADICMALVVNDQTRTFRKHLCAAAIHAEEVGLYADIAR